jgi:hypothetical protein
MLAVLFSSQRNIPNQASGGDGPEIVLSRLVLVPSERVVEAEPAAPCLASSGRVEILLLMAIVMPLLLLLFSVVDVVVGRRSKKKPRREVAGHV